MKHSVRKIMNRLKPLHGQMTRSFFMKLLGYLCGTMIPVLAGYAILQIIGHSKNLSLGLLIAGIVICALLKALMEYEARKSERNTVSQIPSLLQEQPENKEDMEVLQDFFSHTFSLCAVAAVHSVVIVILLCRYHMLTALLALSSYLVTGVVLPYLHVLRYGGSEEETEEDEALEEMDLLEEREEEQLVNNRAEALMTLLTSLFVIMMIIAVILLYRQGTMVYEGALITVVAFMSSFVPLKDMNRHLNAAADLTDIISRLPDQAEKESAS